MACFSTVHKPDANVDYSLFDYVIFPYQSITLHKNKRCTVVCFGRLRGHTCRCEAGRVQNDVSVVIVGTGLDPF